MHKAQILLIEDTDSVREVLTRQLEVLGVSVTALADGDNVKRELDKNIYDLVIADLHLPNCSGFDIARFANAKNCKVILLSGDSNVTSRDDFLTAQFDQILTKPVTLHTLKNMLLQYQLIETDIVSVANSNLVLNQNGMGAIDLNVLVEQMGNLDDVALRMLSQFPKMMRPLITHIVDSSHQKNMPHILEAAHSLKSAARSAGALHLGDISENIQEAASRHIIDDHHIQMLLTEFAKVEIEINGICSKTAAIS